MACLRLLAAVAGVGMGIRGEGGREEGNGIRCGSGSGSEVSWWLWNTINMRGAEMHASTLCAYLVVFDDLRYPRDLRTQ